MTDDRKGSWFNRLSKAARKLAPDKDVERAYDQLKTFHEACNEAVLDAMAAQEMIERDIEKSSSAIETWQERARLALEQDNEQLALQSLQRKVSYMHSNLEFQSQLPLLNQRRLHLGSRLESVKIIVHRLLVLKELLSGMPLPTTLREQLLGAIKNFIEELPRFAIDEKQPGPSFNTAVEIAEQKISKLEQQIANSAQQLIAKEPQHAEDFTVIVKEQISRTESMIEKVTEHLSIQRTIKEQHETEKNEDSAWEAQQLIWSAEKTIESLSASLQALQSILQPK
jgi:hypothetical protein